MEEDFDKIKAEQAEHSVLLDKGIEFKAKDVKYHIAQPRVGQLDKIAAEQIKLDIDKAKLESENWEVRFNEQKRLVGANVKICAKIIAIASVNHHRSNPKLHFWYDLKERYLVWRNTRRLMWELTPATLLELTTIVLKASNLSDFASSIALLSLNRTTAPQAIEEDQLD